MSERRNPISEALRTACGGAHIWVLSMSVASTLLVAGASWGILSTRMTQLEEAVAGLRADNRSFRAIETRLTGIEENFKAFREDDARWKDREWQTDNIHRDRFTSIEKQLYELLKFLPRPAAGGAPP